MLKETCLLITQKMVTQKFQELLSTRPILHLKMVKNILEWVGIAPGSSGLEVFDLTTEPQRYWKRTKKIENLRGK